MSANLYESFNARNYTAQQVAETFITNADFEDLTNRRSERVLAGAAGELRT